MTDALLAAFAALQAALEHTGSNKATRVLSTVVRVTTQLKQQSAALRALTAKSGRSEKR